jgi:hypothetical protein
MPLKDPEARRRYLAENKDRIAAVARAYRMRNKERMRDYSRIYEATHKEERRAIDKRKDPAKQKARYRRYRVDNKDQVAAKLKAYCTRPEIKARKAEQSRKRHALDPLRKREQWRKHRERRQQEAAGRPKPDRCDICCKTDRKIMWDHCHQRGHFRGWICQPCNIALGMVNDDVQHLLKLIAYLQRTGKHTAPQLVLAGI